MAALVERAEKLVEDWRYMGLIDNASEREADIIADIRSRDLALLDEIERRLGDFYRDIGVPSGPVVVLRALREEMAK